MFQSMEVLAGFPIESRKINQCNLLEKCYELPMDLGFVEVHPFRMCFHKPFRIAMYKTNAYQLNILP